MSDDLVQRLRDGAYGADMEAANRIEELEAALWEAAEALRAAADVLKATGSPNMGGRTMGRADVSFAVLGGTPEEQPPVNRRKTADPAER